MSSDSNNNDFEKFLLRIAVGKNPITGEDLPENSAWHDEKVVSDVNKVLAIKPDNAVEVQTGAADSISHSKINTSLLLKQFTNDQKLIWDVIETSINGVAFAGICEKTGFSKAKVQGDLGAISVKAKKLFGDPFKVFNKQRGRYFSHTENELIDHSSVKKTSETGFLTEIKKEFPNAYEPWDDVQDKRLVTLSNRGVSIVRIANELKRQPGAIKSRLARLGVSFDLEDKHSEGLSESEQLSSELNPAETAPRTKCGKCGVLIPIERLKLVPNATQCVTCASSQPFNKRRIHESWGTREDYQKDRASWKSSTRR